MNLSLAEPSLFGLFDFIIIACVIWLDVRSIRSGRLRRRYRTIFLVRWLLFLFVLPTSAILVEWELVSLSHEFADGHETVYAFIRFPVYWLCGLLEFVTLFIIVFNGRQPDRGVDEELLDKDTSGR